MSPEWIVWIGDDPKPVSLQFEELFPVKDQIKKVVLLWDTNSYVIDVVNKSFIINGGRLFQPVGLQDMENAVLEYAARHTRQLSMTADSESSESISYLAGVKGTIENEERQLLIHVSSDGRSWSWKDHK